MARRSLSPRSTLVGMAALMLLASLLPQSLTGWIGVFRGPFMTLVAPVAGPMSRLSGWLRPGESSLPSPADPGAAELYRQIEFYKAEYLASEKRVEDLLKVVQALQEGVAYGPSVRIKRLEATRVGSDLSAGSIDVSRGSMHGVTPNTVATAVNAPQHLVGIVASVGPTVSSVHLITDKRLEPRLIETLVVRDTTLSPEAIAAAVRCQLRPVGDGTLAGDVGVSDEAQIQRGDVAYLDDPYWPGSAQRLILGRVVRVDSTERPLFRRVVVRPELDLSRVRGVILRIPIDEGASPEAGARAP